jgi:hypothetical protein
MPKTTSLLLPCVVGPNVKLTLLTASTVSVSVRSSWNILGWPLVVALKSFSAVSTRPFASRAIGPLLNQSGAAMLVTCVPPPRN